MAVGMVRFEEMSVGVRRVRGPISDMVDLDRRGSRYVAIAFHKAYRDDDVLVAGIAPFRDFLELPMVEGVAPLAAWRRGVFAYPVPQGRTVRELIGVFAEEGGGGVRAALELFAEALVPLVDAARAGTDRGLRCHGSLDPWRLLVDDKGQITVIGYGLPPIDMLDFQQDESQLPVGDSLRYCPPERLDAEPEDWSSDLFSLALVCAELATGRPVYEGPETQILNAVSGCDAPKLLERYPAQLVSVIRQSVSPYAHQRPSDPRALIEAARNAARRAPGRTLAELVQAARPYLSDVEDELPAGLPIAEIVGPPLDEAERRAAFEKAAEAAGQASATVEAMGALLDSVLDQADISVPEVAQAVERARSLLSQAQASAARAEQASDAASSAVDAQQAEAQAALGQAARQEILEVQPVFEQAVAQTRKLTEEAQRAAAERREQAIAAARRAVAQAEAALASLGSAEGVDLDDVEQHVGAAKAAARKAETSRDAGAAERAAERATVAARAAEAAAVSALAAAAAAAERRQAAQAAVARAEAALASCPTPEIAAAVEACRQAAELAPADAAALDLAVVSAEEARQLSVAAAADREKVRQRAWAAVARAEAAGPGEEALLARREAERAQAAVAPAEVLEAALRAEEAAARAESQQQARVRTIAAAIERARAASERIVELGRSWNPEGVASPLATVQQLLGELEAETNEQRAIESATRAERVAEEAAAQVQAALAALAALRERARTAVAEAEAEEGVDPDAADLKAVRAAAAEVDAAWHPETAEKYTKIAEKALNSLRNALRAQQRAAAARERARAAVIAAEATGPRDADGLAFVDAARAAANEAERATDAAKAEEAANRAEEAAAAATAHAAALAERERTLALARERAGKALVAASEWMDRVDETLIAAVHAAAAATQAATDPEAAMAAAERAVHALAAVREAAEDLADRERKLEFLREQTRLSVRRAVDLLDRIDADDVPLVETARAALREIEHTHDLAVAVAASERAEAAAVATREAAARVAERERQLRALREQGDALVAKAQAEGASINVALASPPKALVDAANAVRGGRSALDSTSDLERTRALLSELEQATGRWLEEARQWRAQRDQSLAQARSKAQAAVAKLVEIAKASPSSEPLRLLAEQGREHAGQVDLAVLADDEEGALRALEQAELAVTRATLLLERGKRLDAANQRSAEAMRRITALANGLVGTVHADLARVVDLGTMLEVVKEARGAVVGTSDPDMAWEAAELADATATRAEKAIEEAKGAVGRARDRADRAMERARLAVEAHPALVAEPFYEEARALRDEVYATTSPAQAEALAERADRIAVAAESALEVARQADRQAALAAHRDRAAELHQRARSLAERTGFDLQAARSGAQGEATSELLALLTEAEALEAKLAVSADPIEADGCASRMAEILKSVEPLAVSRALALARSALQEMEEASTQVESLEVQLQLEACRLAASEAERGGPAEQVVAAAAAARLAADEGRKAVAEELVAQQGGRLAAARARAEAAVDRVKAMMASWGHTGPVGALAAAQAHADAAKATDDPSEAEASADRAGEAAKAALDEIRASGLGPHLARAEAALRKAEAAAVGIDLEEMRAALSKVRAEYDAVREASSTAAAAAAAARAEWALPNVLELSQRLKAQLVREHRSRVATALRKTTVTGEAGREFLALIEQLQAEAERSQDLVALEELAVRAEGLAAQAEVRLADERARKEAQERADREVLHHRAMSLAREAVASAEEAASRVSLPEGVPDALALAHGEVTQKLARVRAEAAAAAERQPPEDLDHAEMARTLAGELVRAIEQLQASLLEWQRSRNSASATRAREAVERARRAAAESKKIRDDLSIGRALRQAERAAAAAEAATEPGDADWHAALAVQAAERAQELLEALYREVEVAEATLQELRPVYEEALASSAKGSEAASLHRQIQDVWAQAERAARRGEGPNLEQMGEAIRALAAQLAQLAVRSQPPAPQRPPTPPPDLVPAPLPSPARTPGPQRKAQVQASVQTGIGVPISRELAPARPASAGPTLNPGDFEHLIEAMPDPDEEDPVSEESEGDDGGRTVLMDREQMQQRARQQLEEDDEDIDDLPTSQRGSVEETHRSIEDPSIIEALPDPDETDHGLGDEDEPDSESDEDLQRTAMLARPSNPPVATGRSSDPRPRPLSTQDIEGDPTIRMTVSRPGEADPTQVHGVRLTPTSPPAQERPRKPSEDETIVYVRPEPKHPDAKGPVPNDDATLVLEHPASGKLPQEKAKRPSEDKTIVFERPKRG